MPSRTKKTKRKPASQISHVAFLPLLVLSFIFWILYRGLFQFPVWFDETIGKGIFFGLPVWLYILVSGQRAISDTFASYKVKRGLMLGIAIGGIYGFLAALLAVSQKGIIQPAFPFESGIFWAEFFWAIMTGFWETLFFFSFVFLAIKAKFPKWYLMRQLLVVAGIFLIFHLPNILLRFTGPAVVFQVILLSLFALGQALLFYVEENGYTLVISHALWGMVLLLHF
ncbi:MAG: hypothetical protein COU63_01165 [Candidatus Pacebacteria bacterium CG10_big_fil_rev_8_21_14_0_10_36_11]|nr:hypothetical protein [Candidatus Pacearchaeota archaeon]OIP73801.1 MAG: hypothetical protein AUK08_04555 [Candidatus Pacebacteria bacterium CG2_30_36_39]PIR64613.1 MAG: hypothetical protein COU63_01165 [Candidatus Pacebacteria bacterium CG10_big_fil_rev_8_21_14_0_10_36_11]PJC42955.1 MAG: hypothetical protein CO040_01725 [Candidatus Pacebacteria bacterium CG_4_9_14_0_2_um_filter_36_8]